MATSSQSKRLEELLARYEVSIADAFRAAVADLRANADLQRVIAALEAGDVASAVEALHIDPAAYSGLLDRIRDAYNEGGAATASTMPAKAADGAALVVRFDGRNSAAEAWLRDHSSRLITRITKDQTAAVRTVLEEAMAKGMNPRSAALKIVGRISRVTGKREGGILGLTTAQEGFVRSARAELSSGDPKALRSYLDRTRRDRRFDKTVAKAIRDKKPVPADLLGKAVTAYERRLLALRGETIGRVEAMTALQTSKHEAYRQAIESGKVAASDVRKIWRSASDKRVRHTHQALNGESVGFNEAFRSPSGALLRFPMDTAFGAGPDEIINCRCDCEFRIDFLANVR